MNFPLHLDPSSLTSYFPQAFSARILQHFNECYMLYQRVYSVSKKMLFLSLFLVCDIIIY